MSLTTSFDKPINGGNAGSIQSGCVTHKKELLITVVVLLALAALVLGLMTLLATSHDGFKGLNALGTLGGISLVGIGSVIFLLAILSVRAGKKTISTIEPIAESLGEILEETEKITPPSNLKEERSKPDAALTIQCAWRMYVAKAKLQTLKVERSDKQRLEELRAQRLKKVERAAPPLKFESYTAEPYFNGCKESIPIHSEDDVEHLVKKIHEEIYQKHIAMSVYFKGWPIDRERKERMESFQKAPSATHLQFSMPRVSTFLRVQLKPFKIENLGNGSFRHFYSNGVVETFLSSEDRFRKGVRVFPDGRQEKGEFDKEGKFISGYRIGLEKEIEFVHPEALAFFKEKSTTFEICEVEEKLVVLKRTYVSPNVVYERVNLSVDEVLLKASLRLESIYSEGVSIIQVLRHKDFETHLARFLEYALGKGDSGTPRLFGFSNAAIIDILVVGSKFRDINPLEIMDPLSKRNIFVQAAHWGNCKLLNKLIEIFPQPFLLTGQDALTEFLHQEHDLWKGGGIFESFEKLGGKLDLYQAMWLQVAKLLKPDENFKREFPLLSSEKKRVLYDAAFSYNNPYVYEPSDIPISADQYSINLMWINKNKIARDQEFLFGEGSSKEERELDFQKKFVIPVSKWAKANPGSPINIWVDGEMATAGAIERSREALQKSLEGISHGTTHFRDVRSIELVCENKEAFEESRPIYFRVDLLRAIAADYVLNNKETKYFVYGDIDMKPLSGEQIFDKRTLHFLDDFGFVMAKGGSLGFENGFQILNGDNLRCLDSHRKVIIDLSIQMALENPKTIKEQQVYDTYTAMITHFLAQDGRYGKLNLQKKENHESKFKLKNFRYDRFGTQRYTLPLGECKVRVKDVMPRKPVNLPPSHF